MQNYARLDQRGSPVAYQALTEVLFSLTVSCRPRNKNVSLRTMNNSIRNITIIVMVALTLIIGYQAYWLVGLYGTMSRKMHSDIMEAMRKADYEEIDTRIKKLRRQNDYKTTTFMLYYKKNKGGRKLGKVSLWEVSVLMNRSLCRQAD